MNRRTGCIAVAAISAFLLDVARSPAAEDTTIEAFAVWQGRGHVFETGSKQATFVGALVGTVYVETEQGPIEAGQIACPATVTISLDDNSQSGSGHCVITASDGARAYADVSCSGFHLVGCNGDFKLTGGTGRFAGISGGGPVIIRSDFRSLVQTSESSVQEKATGIIYWRELRYKIP